MRFHGVVGYGESVETSPNSGKWEDQIKRVEYYGDVKRNTKQTEPGSGVNDDISVRNSIEIVADEYAVGHFFNIRFVMWMGQPWTVTDVAVQGPRLILSLGKVYNGPTE